MVAWQNREEPLRTQAGVAEAHAKQAVPQVAGLEMSASQPSQGSPSQLAQPVVHIGWQTPPELHVFVDT
jgi:hypothetical protein